MELEVLFDQNAEKAVIGSMMIVPDVTPEVVNILGVDDFGTKRGKDIYIVLLSMFDQNLPYDIWLVGDEAKRLNIDIDMSFLLECVNYPTSVYARHYAELVKKYSTKRFQAAIASEYAKRIYSGESPDVTEAWLMGEVSKRKSAADANMSLIQSLQRQRELIELWESPENQEELARWAWAWATWNSVISPPPAGILTLISAAESTGKTIVAEVQAEYWAKMGNNVVFFHLELNKDVMISRRLSRISGIPYRNLVSNRLSPEQKKRRDAVEGHVAQWPGNIEYVSCAGWNVDQICAEARRLNKEGLCDAFILDYFQKIQMSPRQERRRMDENTYQRDAVEQLAILTNSAPCRGVVLSQLTKSSKSKSATLLTGADLMGTAALGEKANVSVMLHKEILPGGKPTRDGKGYIVDPGGYDTEATVKVVKNTLGRQSTFTQHSTATFDWRDEPAIV